MLPRLTPLRHSRRATLAVAAAATVVLATLGILLLRGPAVTPATAPVSASRARGPWVFGQPLARFTIIEYADLECPYCRMYFPTLRRWIKEHPEVNWQWRNLPLPMHEPAALREALWAECAGEVGGNAAFWQEVDWIYEHTRGDGRGLPVGAQRPAEDSRIKACLRSAAPRALIRGQGAAAAQEHITATPTLQIIDHSSGRSLLLQGPAGGDALLSAIDLLATANGGDAAHGAFSP